MSWLPGWSAGAAWESLGCRHVRMGRSVAVKLLSSTMASEVGVRERFEVEARSAARLSKPLRKRL